MIEFALFWFSGPLVMNVEPVTCKNLPWDDNIMDVCILSLSWKSEYARRTYNVLS